MGIWFGAVESLGTLGALHRNPTLFNTLVVIFMFCTMEKMLPRGVHHPTVLTCRTSHECGGKEK